MLEDEGYEVLTAADGRQALDLVRGTTPRPDAIVTDLMMPVLASWAFVEWCRQVEGCASIPILVMSAALDPARTEDWPVKG